MSVLAPLPVPILHREPNLPDERQQLSDRQVEEIVQLYLELLRNNKKVNHGSRRDSAVVEEDEGYGTDATKLRHRSYTLQSNDVSKRRNTLRWMKLIAWTVRISLSR